jgi:hypothetical protein
VNEIHYALGAATEADEVRREMAAGMTRLTQTILDLRAENQTATAENLRLAEHLAYATIEARGANERSARLDVENVALKSFLEAICSQWVAAVTELMLFKASNVQPLDTPVEPKSWPFQDHRRDPRVMGNPR